MLPLKTQWSSSSMKKTLIIITGLSLLMCAFYAVVSVHTFAPQITGNFTKLINFVPYFKSIIFNNSLEDGTFLHSEKIKKLANDSTETTLFTSPYIITSETYHSKSKTHLPKTTRKQKVISCYDCPPFFTHHHLNLRNRDFKACAYSECTFDSGDRSSTADVVLYFVGMIGKRQFPRRPAGQIWVKCYWESPVHYSYPTPYEPWKSAFNWTLNYRTDSDIFAPNNRLAWRNSSDLFPDSVYLEIAKNKTKSVAWFVSNCETQSRREIYVKELQKYIDVDIYGRCGNMSCGRGEEKDCETNLTTTYKFYLGFENSFCKDYVTEKLFRNIQYRTHIIPVVRGGFDYNKYIPNGIFVNAANFSSAKDLALHLKELGNDHERYARMLKEKDKLTTLNYKFDWCDFCEKVHTDNETKVIPDIKMWSHKNACQAPVDIHNSR